MDKSMKIVFLVSCIYLISIHIMGQINVSDILVSPYMTSESSVFIHPNNPNIALLSNNTKQGLSLPHCDAFFCRLNINYSTNSGNNWVDVSSISFPGSGDPSVVVDNNGNFYIGCLSSLLTGHGGISVFKSTDNGNTWTGGTVINILGQCIDKPHLWLDNKKLNQNNLNNTFYNNLYISGVQFFGNCILGNSPNFYQILFSYSNNSGTSWSVPQNITGNTNHGCTPHAPNIKTGPNGEVYVCWTIYDNCTGQNLDPATALGFAKSLDGGMTFSSYRIQNINGVTGVSGGKYLNANSFPSMAVNQQNGHIYITWAEQVSPNDIDIFFIRSQDHGITWTTPIRVNQDNTTTDQFFPWMACDPINNVIAVVYLDSRNFSQNDKCDTYVSLSYDEGNTWTDYKINDISWIPFGPLVGYDYIGIDAKFGHVIPVWSQGDGGQVYTYTNPFDIPCPPNMNLTYGNYYITDEVTFSYDASYSANSILQVAGQSINGSTYKIYPNASVYMSAGDEIIIEDGFESEGELIVENIGCTNISSRMNGPLNNSHSVSTSIRPATEKTILKKKEYKNDVILFPNPATDRIKIQSNLYTGRIHIMNSMGEMIYSHLINEQKAEINIENLSNGIYLVIIESEEGIHTEKLIIQR